MLGLTPEVPLVTCDVLILAVSLRVVCDDSSLVTRAEGLSMDSIVFDPSRKVRCPIVEKSKRDDNKTFWHKIRQFFCQIMHDSTAKVFLPNHAREHTANACQCTKTMKFRQHQ